MKIEHKKKRTFGNIGDIVALNYCVRRLYDPEYRYGSDIVSSLCYAYENLKPAEVDLLVYDGTFIRKNHKVCVTTDGQFLIDPTGDSFTATDVNALKSNMTPWIYMKDGNMYWSLKRMPILQPMLTMINGKLAPTLAQDVIATTGENEEYNDLRCIILKEAK